MLPAGEIELAGHDEHALAPESDQEPARHSSHSSLPAAALCLPAAHAEHAPPLGPVKPALHVQAMAAALPAGELELLGHSMQTSADVAPIAAEYVPGDGSRAH